MSKENQWIKSKIVVFFGVNERFADMFTVDSQFEIDLIHSTVYPFPYYYKVFDDIPRVSESVSKMTMNGEEKSISVEMKSINGMVSTHKNILKAHATEYEDCVNKIEKLFGKQ